MGRPSIFQSPGFPARRQAPGDKVQGCWALALQVGGNQPTRGELLRVRGNLSSSAGKGPGSREAQRRARPRVTFPRPDRAPSTPRDGRGGLPLPLCTMSPDLQGRGGERDRGLRLHQASERPSHTAPLQLRTNLHKQSPVYRLGELRGQRSGLVVCPRTSGAQAPASTLPLPACQAPPASLILTLGSSSPSDALRCLSAPAECRAHAAPGDRAVCQG